MNFIILDLEWNAAYSRKLKGYINEIIEFGAVKCNENLEIVDTFSSFVKLQVGKKISHIVSELTTIKDENLSDAKLFMQVVSKFNKWSKDSVILTWGTSDILTLIENCRYFSGSGNIPFLDYYVDMQAYCQRRLDMKVTEQLGLNKAAEILNIDVSSMVHHRALGDSFIALEIFKRIADENSLKPFVQNARCDEFYKKMTFKTTIIYDMEHPLINKKNMVFTCEKCGGEAERLKKWQVRNKRFFSDFKCKNCGYKFTGRIQIKQKYEGLILNKKSIPLPKIEIPRKAENASVGNMNLEIKNGVGLLKFKDWQNVKGITHCFSTRIGGVSQNEFASMNLGFGRGDINVSVFRNYELMANALEVDKESFIAGAQDHNLGIRRVDSLNAGIGIYKPRDMESIDGLCTNELGVTLVIYGADCVPIYYYDPVNRAIAVAHAGWKGTIRGMAKEMVLRMAQEFGTNPKDLLVAIGPSASKESYEVDGQCAKEFLALPNSETIITKNDNDKYQADMWQCNINFLTESGVPVENITVGDVCTIKNSDLVFSHRVTMGHRGSNTGFLALT